MANHGESIPDIFADFLAELCSRAPLAEHRSLYWTIIANPRAGGFTILSRWNHHFEQLQASLSRARANPVQAAAAPSQTALSQGDSRGFVLTRGPGFAGAVTEALVKEAAAFAGRGPDHPLFLIITAGGDGTSLEVLSALYLAPKEIRSCFAVLRLPMGTGNDGADAWELEDALHRIIGKAELSFQAALRLVTSTPGKGPFLAFNVLSVGLDAFVTHMTNKMKGKLPGDFYKLWVDIAALLYDKLYKVGPMDVRVLDDSGKETARLREKILLLAVGESGYRTYGSHKKILPDERNICAVRQMPLFRKIALKGLFTTGAHRDKPETTLLSGRRVEIIGEYPILAQMDGEAVLLKKEDFPIVIERSEPLIPVLKPV